MSSLHIPKLEAVFVDSGDRYLQKNYSEILAANKEKAHKIWAWKNDKITAQAIIFAFEEDLSSVCARAEDLTGKAEIISSDNIKLSFVKEVRAYIGHAGWYANNPLGIEPKGKRESYPEVIYSEDPVFIGKRQFKILWIEVNIPAYASAGTYNTKITVSSKNTDEEAVLNLSVEVLDIEMPKAEDYVFDVEYWSHPYNVAYYYEVEPFSSEHIEILKQHMTVYKNLGGHAIVSSITEEAWGGQTYGGNNKIHYPSMIKWIKKADGSFAFDYTDFDKCVKLGKDIGIADKIICYSIMPWKNIIRYYDEKSEKIKKIRAGASNEEKYSKLWTPFLKSFVKHLDEKGWFDSVYMGFDERHNMQTALNLLKAFHNKDGKTFKISASFNNFTDNADVFNQLDYAGVGLDQVRNNLEKFKEQVMLRRSENRETTIYTATDHIPNSFTKSFPVESYWTIMYCGKMNTTGFLRWAYDAWVKEPLKDSTHCSFPAGDCFLVYPSEKNEGVKETKLSLRLAKLDEGVRDINKLYILSGYSDEFSEKVKALLSNVKGDTQGAYEYYTVKRTNIWGRTAKWLTDSAKSEMIYDMNRIKKGIYDLSAEYIEKNS